MSEYIKGLWIPRVRKILHVSEKAYTIFRNGLLTPASGQGRVLPDLCSRALVAYYRSA